MQSLCVVLLMHDGVRAALVSMDGSILQRIVAPGMFILHGDIAAGGQILLDAIA